MRNEILILSVVAPNVYFLGPMGDLDPSDFIYQETNQLPFKHLQWICPLGIPKLSSEIGQRCLRDGEIGSIGCQEKGWRLGALWSEPMFDPLVVRDGEEWFTPDFCILFLVQRPKRLHFLSRPNAITLANVYMLTSLRITGSMQPYDFYCQIQEISQNIRLHRMGKLHFEPCWRWVNC